MPISVLVWIAGAVLSYPLMSFVLGKNKDWYDNMGENLALFILFGPAMWPVMWMYFFCRWLFEKGK